MQNQKNPPLSVDEALLTSAKKVMPIIFAEANGDISRLMNQLLNNKQDEKIENTLLVALMGSKLLGVADAVTAITRQPNKESALLLGKAYLSSVPNDGDAIVFMEGVRTKAPELLGETIAVKTNWTKKTIREQLNKYIYSSELWHQLAQMADELSERK